VIIVGQRVATIRHADQIVVLEKGSVVGLGTHDELLAGCRPTGDRGIATAGGGGVSTRSTTAPPEAPKTGPVPQQRLGQGPGRWGALGMPAEKTANFKQSLRRMAAMLRIERFGFAAVIVLAVVSVSLTVLGPRILGRATDVIFKGLTHGGAAAIDFGSLHRILLFVAGLYVVAAVLGYLQSYVLAGIVQRTMYRLRRASRPSSTGCRCATSTARPGATSSAGSPTTSTTWPRACSRRCPDAHVDADAGGHAGDDVLGVVVLALVALVTIPLSLYTIKLITKRSRVKFVAQWATPAP